MNSKNFEALSQQVLKMSESGEVSGKLAGWKLSANFLLDLASESFKKGNDKEAVRLRELSEKVLKEGERQYELTDKPRRDDIWTNIEKLVKSSK